MANQLSLLAALLKRERATVLSRWRLQARELDSARDLDAPALSDHIPGLLDELCSALEIGSEQTIPQALSAGSSAPAHGLQRLHDGFNIEEVVAEYNILRGCVHDLAQENGVDLQGKPFHILNRVFDRAIGVALQTYATQRALEIQRRREEYLAFVAHDLRTPLNAISLASHVLVTEPNLQSNHAQMVRALQRNVKHLESLVAKVLDENTNLKTEIGVKLERREFDLWPLVQALIQDLHPVAGTSSTVLVNAVPEDLVVFADANLLRRVFQNLIANAIRYTPRGKVVIGAQELLIEGVECWVQDNGAGIPEAMHERIFEMGESDKDTEAVSGIGLAIVKTFTEAHGGRVEVSSTPGKGSTFRLFLPRQPGAGNLS